MNILENSKINKFFGIQVTKKFLLLGSLFFVFGSSSRFFLNKKILENNIFSKDNVEYLFEIAYEIGKSGDHQEAILAYNKVINSDSNNYQAYFNLGWHFGELGKYTEAINNYTKAIEINNGDYSVFFNRGIDKIYNGDIEASCSDFLKAQKLGDLKALNELEKYCYRYV